MTGSRTSACPSGITPEHGEHDHPTAPPPTAAHRDMPAAIQPARPPPSAPAKSQITTLTGPRSFMDDRPPNSFIDDTEGCLLLITLRPIGSGSPQRIQTAAVTVCAWSISHALRACLR
jgi:hypothetical protein